jgi:hypothetical protein
MAAKTKRRVVGGRRRRDGGSEIGMHNRISSKRRKELCRGNMRKERREEREG